MTRLVEFSDQIQIVSIYHSVVFSSEAHKFFFACLKCGGFCSTSQAARLNIVIYKNEFIANTNIQEVGVSLDFLI